MTIKQAVELTELQEEGLTPEEALVWADTPFSAKDILFYIQDGILTPDELEGR